MIIFILALNCLLMGLCWSACLIVTTPAFNHFIQYGEGSGILPSLTQNLIDARFYLIAVPLFWIAAAIMIYLKIYDLGKEDQTVILLGFSLTTICAGFIMILLYGLCAVLPYLKIGVAL